MRMLDEHAVPQTPGNTKSMLASGTVQLARQIYTRVPHDGAIVNLSPDCSSLAIHK